MNVLRGLAGKLIGLFVDDRLFALAVAAWLGAVAAAGEFALGSAEVRSIVLFAGLATILVASIWRAARP